MRCSSLTVRLIAFTVNIDRRDASDLIRHVVYGRRNGTSAHRLGVAAHQPDKDGMTIRNSVDTRQECVTDPRVGSGLDGNETNEEG